MEYYNLEEGKYPNKNEKNTQDEFFGDGWSIRKEDGNHIFSYISGDHQGKLKELKISEDDYNLLISGKSDLDKICIKYNAY